MNTGQRIIDRGGLRARLVFALLALVIASVAAVGTAAFSAFDRAVEPELDNRTRLIGTIVRAEVQRALELGIPMDSIAGLERYLADTLAKFDEVERIDVTAANGQIIASIQRPGEKATRTRSALGESIAFQPAPFVLPIIDGNRLVGEIRVETSPLFVQTRMREVFLDVLVISLVATLIALELALAVGAASVGKPLEGLLRLLGEQREGNFVHRIRPVGVGALRRMALRLNDHAQDLGERLAALPAAARDRVTRTLDARVVPGAPRLLRQSDVGDIRLALFLLSVATEIAAAFLPLYAREAARPQWLTPELASAAPLGFYLLAMAALAPFGGSLTRRFGARRLFLVSVPVSVLGLFGMGFSDGIAGVVLWRAVIALSYGIATIACQEYAVRAAGLSGRTRAFGASLAVIYGGVFCGLALGGVIAGRLSFQAAFAGGALIGLVSGAIGWSAMRGDAGDPMIAGGRAPSAPGGSRWFGARYVALLIGAAVPMNAATAIFVWYLAPLMLGAIGSGPAEIGRVVMLYYLAIVVFGPAAARLADRWCAPGTLVVIGAAVCAAAFLSLSEAGGFRSIVVTLAAVGLGHALMRAPLYSLASEVAAGSGAALGALRAIERVGALAGLTASAFLLGEVGAVGSVRALGATVLAGIGLFVAVELGTRSAGR